MCPERSLVCPEPLRQAQDGACSKGIASPSAFDRKEPAQAGALSWSRQDMSARRSRLHIGAPALARCAYRFVAEPRWTIRSASLHLNPLYEE